MLNRYFGGNMSENINYNNLDKAKAFAKLKDLRAPSLKKKPDGKANKRLLNKGRRRVDI